MAAGNNRLSNRASRGNQIRAASATLAGRYCSLHHPTSAQPHVSVIGQTSRPPAPPLGASRCSESIAEARVENETWLARYKAWDSISAHRRSIRDANRLLEVACCASRSSKLPCSGRSIRRHAATEPGLVEGRTLLNFPINNRKRAASALPS